MNSIQFFGLKIFLLHLLVLCNHGGSGEASMETMISAQNDNVLKLPSMDDGVMHRYHHHHHIDSSMKVFFTMDDLKIGKKMPIYFPIQESLSSSPLLSKEQANSIPFSYKNFPYLLNLFSFSPQSTQAKAMEHTLQECESEPLKGEVKACPTSVEFMHDFIHQIFGSNTEFRVLKTTHLRKSNKEVDNYTIMARPREIQVPTMVACHTMPYPYRVFYCHSQKTENRVFLVSLIGDDGARVETVAVCHMDTSQWSKDHASFLVLNIEPGSSHVCHFFRGDAMVYVPLYT